MCALDNIDESFTCFQVQVTRYLFICWKNWSPSELPKIGVKAHIWRNLAPLNMSVFIKDLNTLKQENPLYNIVRQLSYPRKESLNASMPISVAPYHVMSTLKRDTFWAPRRRSNLVYNSHSHWISSPLVFCIEHIGEFLHGRVALIRLWFAAQPIIKWRCHLIGQDKPRDREEERMNSWRSDFGLIQNSTGGLEYGMENVLAKKASWAEIRLLRWKAIAQLQSFSKKLFNIKVIINHSDVETQNNGRPIECCYKESPNLPDHSSGTG